MPSRGRFRTKNGLIKKTSLGEFKNINNSGLIAIKIKEDDDIIFVGLIEDVTKEEILIATHDGYCTRFLTDTIRPTGRSTQGVKAITLREGDAVVSAMLIKNPETDILTITENGYGKRTSLDEYPQYNRGGKGVINLKASEKTGKVVSVLEVTEDEELMCITSNGIVIRTSISEISRIGRATQGVRITKVADEEKVAAITKIKKEEEELED